MNESSYFTQGKNRLIINIKGWKLCPLICYDLRFPVFSRNNEDYDMLVYVANWQQPMTPLPKTVKWTQTMQEPSIRSL